MGIYQVTCIRRDGSDPDRRIDALGGPDFATSPIDDVINWIDNGHAFFVQVGNDRAYLEVLTHPRSRRRYLRTVPDGLYDNNLYSLGNCPS